MADELTPSVPLAADAPLQSQQPSLLDRLTNAVMGQESSYGANTATSPTGARGPMQIEPATFQRFAAQNESIDNPDDNIKVGRRILSYYLQKYGDPARAAVAYFSGEGNVAPVGSPTPWKNDASDGGTTVSQYVASVGHRLGDPNMIGMARMQSAMAASNAGMLTPESSLLDSTTNFAEDLFKQRASPPPSAAPTTPPSTAPTELPKPTPPQPIPTPPAKPLRQPSPIELYIALLKRHPMEQESG